jgi:hypothetical protein
MTTLANVGWVVYDSKGLNIGTIATLPQPPTSSQSDAIDSENDSDTMIVESKIADCGPWLYIPITAIRATMRGRILLTEPLARFAELGWTVRPAHWPMEPSDTVPAVSQLTPRTSCP